MKNLIDHDLSETLINEGVEGIKDYVIMPKSEVQAERIYKYVMIAVILILWGYIVFAPKQKSYNELRVQAYTEAYSYAKHVTDSLQFFVDTTLNYEPILKPKK